MLRLETVFQLFSKDISLSNLAHFLLLDSFRNWETLHDGEHLKKRQHPNISDVNKSSEAPGPGGQAGLHLQLAIPPLEWR